MNVTLRRGAYEDAANIARIHIASWRAAYKGVIHQSALDNLDAEKRWRKWKEIFENPKDDYALFVALDGDRLVGFGDIGAAREESKAKKAEIYALYLDPSCYGQGIGQLLFEQCKDHAIQCKHEELFTWVLKDHGSARGFYERMGGLLVAESEKPYPIGDKDYPVIRYAWDLPA